MLVFPRLIFWPSSMLRRITVLILPWLLAACGAKPVPLLTVACPLAVTRTATLGRQIAHAADAALENLEAFAVARAAAAAGIDAVTAVLGIANRVGPRGHQEWRAHHTAASRAACRLIWSFLKSEA